MAYQTGNAKNMAELFPQMITLMKTQGWILDKQGIEPGYDSYTAWYLHHPDVGYFNFHSWGNVDLSIQAATGFDGSKTFNQQPGASGECWVYLGDYNQAILSYDLFITSRYCHVVIQGNGNHFYHFGFGTLNKEGTYTGGQYMYMGYMPAGYNSGSYPFDHHDTQSGTFVRAELPGETAVNNGWYPFRRGSSRAMGLGAPMMAGDHPDVLAVESSLSVLGGVLAPVPNAIYATTSQNTNIRLGVVPDFCLCHMKGLTPRAKVAVNGEQWMVVPINQLTFTKPTHWDNGTFTYAYAYRISV
ncbi:hypothetical protein CKQ16_10415 [Salmonella enterica subsp. enterica serovar Newport]|nr:hypothetical protein [Salmonella enterica subsp. enterica serovar Newport]